MEKRRQRGLGRLHSYGWGVAAPVLCTLLTWPLSHSFGPASILMIYLLGVFLVATRHGRGASILASLLSAAAFAYFFAPPIFSLAVADTENIVALTATLLVANVTSNLMEKIRSQADIAAQRERRATALYHLSEALSAARSEDEVVRTAVRHIHAEFGAQAAALFPEMRSRIGRPTDAALPQPLPGTDNSGTQEEKTFLDTFRNQITQSLERVRLAEQARDASIQAEAEALRNSLLSAISHDLRTPLTRIVGTASTLAEQDASLASAERQEFTRAIRDEALRMSELMSKILDMARLSAGKIVLQREWNALEEIVGGTLTRLDAELSERPVAIRLPENLPLMWVDAVLLQQVLMNLIENAVKYTPAGSPIDISAECLPASLRIAVADRGPGIAEELKGRLFEKFQRLAPESSQSGVGLGLALCRAIVAAHGGEIGVDNRPGGGAVFFLTLPLHEPPPPLAWDETAEVKA